MVDYTFYSQSYLGDSIPETEFPRLALRAGEQLAGIKRRCQVTGGETAEAMAVCAMADSLRYFETASNGGIATKYTVGNVSGSISEKMLPDMSPAALQAELYRCAETYLDIYRGCPDFRKE